MPFDGFFISKLITEIKTELVGKRINKISQPHQDAVLFSFSKKQLFITIESSMPYFTITEASMKNPPEPPMFTMLLRKYLQGAKLIDIRQLGFERVITLEFEALSNFGEHTTRCLVIEIMGKHSNLILTEGGKVIDSLKRVSIDTSVRPILPGMIYPVFETEKKTIFDSLLYFDSDLPLNTQSLISKIQGMSKPLAIFLINKFQTFPEIKTYLINKLENENSGYIFGNSHDFYWFSEFSENITFSSGYCETVSKFYMDKVKTLKMHQASLDTKKIVKQRLDRLENKKHILIEEIYEADHSEQLRKKGDAILSHLHLLSKGMNKAILVDYSSETLENVELSLDTKLTPIENANQYFKKYQKMKNAQKILREQLELTLDDLAYLDSTLTMLENVDSLETLSQIRNELSDLGFLKKEKSLKKDQKTAEFRVFNTAQGFEVIVGKTNLQNDKLTLKLASNSDIFLHTKDIPGSHTILKTSGKTVDHETIREAAKIAAFYSKARYSSTVPVDYTLVKFVSKPSGAKPGKVIYTNQKTIYVDPEPI